MQFFGEAPETEDLRCGMGHQGSGAGGPGKTGPHVCDVGETAVRSSCDRMRLAYRAGIF